MSSSTINSIKQKIFIYSTETLGFDDCRFTDPFVGESLEEYKSWLKQGLHGEMKYLEEHSQFKENPDWLLKGVRSAMVLIKNYKNTSRRRLEDSFKIARYAVGQDYHTVMQNRLKELCDFIKIDHPESEFYYGVDSRPLPERSLALKAGIGFRGKNTMVIKPGLGSYFFIGVILTTQSFDNDSPLNWNCGNCRRCLDACPTGALVPTAPVSEDRSPIFGGTSARSSSSPSSAPQQSYSLDATQCISYLTIEKKQPLSAAEVKKTDGWIFGCDICQEVCPYNHGQTPLTDWKEFHPDAGVGFDFFQKEIQETDIPKTTPLYRSRKRVVPNLKLAKFMSRSLFTPIEKF